MASETKEKVTIEFGADGTKLESGLSGLERKANRATDGMQKLLGSNKRVAHQITGFSREILSGASAADVFANSLEGVERSLKLPLGALAGLGVAAVAISKYSEMVDKAAQDVEKSHEDLVKALNIRAPQVGQTTQDAETNIGELDKADAAARSRIKQLSEMGPLDLEANADAEAKRRGLHFWQKRPFTPEELRQDQIGDQQKGLVDIAKKRGAQSQTLVDAAAVEGAHARQKLLYDKEDLQVKEAIKKAAQDIDKTSRVLRGDQLSQYTHERTGQRDAEINAINAEKAGRQEAADAEKDIVQMQSDGDQHAVQAAQRKVDLAQEEYDKIADTMTIEKEIAETKLQAAQNALTNATTEKALADQRYETEMDIAKLAPAFQTGAASPSQRNIRAIETRMRGVDEELKNDYLSDKEKKRLQLEKAQLQGQYADAQYARHEMGVAGRAAEDREARREHRYLAGHGLAPRALTREQKDQQAKDAFFDSAKKKVSFPKPIHTPDQGALIQFAVEKGFRAAMEGKFIYLKEA